MPYMLVHEGDKWCTYKKNPDGSKGENRGCSDSEEKGKAHLRALYVHEKSLFPELSLFISRASFETNEVDPNKRMRFRMSSSDVDADLSGEKMSLELFNNFKRRMETKDIPEAFKSVICEEDWCGGMPYLSIAHYKSGASSKNVPGYIEELYVDGSVLKSKACCYDTPLGHAVFNSLLDDQTKRKSGLEDFKPVRVSIGFLDLQHKHAPDGGQEYVFTRTEPGQTCPLCEKGIGDKIYWDGVLVHKALTRVPMNPRTDTNVELEQKSMEDEITTRKDDARSIVNDLADTLDVPEVEEKSRVLVIKSDGTIGSEPSPYINEITKCYDPNVDSFDQSCVDATMQKFMVDIRNSMHVAVKSEVPDDVVTSLINTSLKSIIGTDIPVVEESMNTKTDEKEKVDNKKEDEMEKEHEKMHKSALDTTYENLKSILAGKPTVDKVQAAFNALGEEVEKSYTPEPPSATDIGAIVKSAVEAAIAPLNMRLSQLEAARITTEKTIVPKSRSLFVQPDLTKQVNQNSQSQVGTHGRPIVNGRELTQVEHIAYKSTGAI